MRTNCISRTSTIDNEPTRFYSVAKVGSGFSDAKLEDLNRKTENSWRNAKGGEKAVGIEWTKEKPDVWIKPSESFILQVLGANHN